MELKKAVTVLKNPVFYVLRRFFKFTISMPARRWSSADQSWFFRSSTATLPVIVELEPAAPLGAADDEEVVGTSE
jgi:hypothetical protein